MKEMSHLELYRLIGAFKYELCGYSLMVMLLNKNLINLNEADYHGFLNFLECETNHLNLVDPDAIHNDCRMYYETIKENDEIKIIIKEGQQDDLKTISTFKIKIVDNY